MDRAAGLRDKPAMRPIVLLAVLIPLAACSGDPKALGITGPGPQTGPITPALPGDSPDTNANPGAPTTGSVYGPNNGPVTGPSGFYNYN